MLILPVKRNRLHGITLPIVLILLVPLTLLAVMVAKRNNLEELMAASQRDGQQALMNAESGLEFAEAVFAEMAAGTYTYSLDEILNEQQGQLVYAGTSLENYSNGEVTFKVTVRDNEDPDVPHPTNSAYNCVPYDSTDDTSNPDLPTNYAEDCVWEIDLDQRLVVTSTGFFRGAERIVEADFWVATSSSLVGMSVFAEGRIEVIGNPDIYGPDARLHSNADFVFSGSVQVDGIITQSDSVLDYDTSAVTDFSGNPVAVTVVARLDTPYVYPPVYKGLATRYLTWNCDVWDGPPGGDNPLTGNSSVLLKAAKDSGGAATPTGYNGWICDATCFETLPSCKNLKWDLKGGDAVSDFYYVEGNVTIGGKTGSSTDPLEISVVAEGFIEVTGTPFLTPYYSSEETVDFTNATSEAEVSAIDPSLQFQGLFAKDQVLKSYEVLLLAGGDLSLKGNSTTAHNFNGVLAAHGQFELAGNPSIQGGLFSEGASYSDESEFFDNIASTRQATNNVTANTIHGNPDLWGAVNLGGDPVGGPPLGVTMLTWRELVD